MKLLIYSSDGEQRRRLLDAINAYTPYLTLETFGDVKSLGCRLRRMFTGNVWLVLIVVNLSELYRLAGLTEFIRNSRNMLVLPNQNYETVAVGHSLYPRLISYLNSDYGDVCSVLGKAIQKSKKKQPNPLLRRTHGGENGNRHE